MGMYRFKASDRTGKVSEISIEAESSQDALRRLRGRGLVPIESYGEGAGGKSKSFFSKKNNFNVYQFIDRLVPLLRAHIQLDRALGIMIDGTADKYQKEVVISLRRGLQEGKKLSSLVRSKPECFPPICANLIEAGEESGALIEVMIELKHFLDYKKETSEFIVSSAIYPCIIIFVTLTVIILLFTVFVPRFTKIFAQMGQALPLPTQIMVWISNIMTGYWWAWLGLIAAISFAIIKVRKDEKGRIWWDRKMLQLPLFGGIILSMEIGRFIQTLSVLIKNNVHLVSTVTISSKVIENKALKVTLSKINTDLKGGKKLSKALSISDYMPKIVLQMLEVGEESGNMGGMLGEVATELEKDMKLKIKRLLALFEPACILFLAAVVAVVVVSIFLSIMQMSNIK